MTWSGIEPTTPYTPGYHSTTESQDKMKALQIVIYNANVCSNAEHVGVCTFLMETFLNLVQCLQYCFGELEK